MAKTKISQYSSTAGSNTDIDNINIAEGCSPANVNNAIRGLMAQLKDFQSGNATFYTADSDALAVGAGGTGAITANTARTNLSAAKSGANSDITSITGLTTALSTAQGGTGAVQRAISNVARTSNVVTITTSVAHGFAAGEYVTVTATTNTSLNGTFVIATVGSTTFTYAQSGVDISSVADTGTAVDITYCNLVNNVKGTLTVGNGGTGVTTNAPNAVLVGNATSAITSVRPGTNANVLTSTAGATVNAVDLVEGVQYTILTTGTTNWTFIGAGATSVGTVFVKNSTAATGDGTATINTWTSAALPSTIIRGTLVTTTSGSTADFTGIPSWVKKITVMFNGISVGTSSRMQIQLGTSSGLTTSGYVSLTCDKGGLTATATSGLLITQNTDVAGAYSGIAVITNITGNTWVMSSSLFSSTSTLASYSGGNIALSATLDRLTILPVTGGVSFDAGSVNILYE